MDNNMEQLSVVKEKKPTLRDNIYSNLQVSLKTIDKIILILFGLLVFAIIMGIIR